MIVIIRRITTSGLERFTERGICWVLDLSATMQCVEAWLAVAAFHGSSAGAIM
jgi:hypothetical protein